MANSLNQLLTEIRACEICKEGLPHHEPRPVVEGASKAKIMIVGQAPGSVVHASGVPWDDASGRNLRRWLGVTDEQFYDPNLFAIVPMGFCYPGKGKSGDLPPRPECAPKWHKPLFDLMPEIKLTLLIGLYAQAYYLGDRRKRTLTETVTNYQEYLPEYLPLVHPSPRNGIWQRKHPWFEAEVVPELQQVVKTFI